MERYENMNMIVWDNIGAALLVCRYHVDGMPKAKRFTNSVRVAGFDLVVLQTQYILYALDRF